ncbi:TonB-dependent receptor plug domain-containing protein [Litoribacter ruber]|uniref:TonB-dependent receptor plug domain-containing protein n=1 Tax=Litoribacter ruber TaxID=702568 RepID=UPI001BD92C45|nr:TonB-dependent receptor plug domain-containing protein [Litoribacter ruber]MBT0810576.1 TonB-dependent receptor plug domain-containing protein [Litoribacter ruber]
MRNLLILFCLIALLIPPLSAQDKTSKIKENLKIYRESFTPEKIYLHLDKSHFLGGEIIWLKAYVLRASDLKATERSGVLYVDLLDDEGSAVEKLTLPVFEGESYGDITLPDDLEAGTYKLTAYTRWMRNFGEETFFQKEIQVLAEGSEIPTENASSSIPIDEHDSPLSIQVQEDAVLVTHDLPETTELILMAFLGDKMIFDQTLEENMTSVEIPREDFQTGISKFVLVNPDGDKVAERLFFVNQEFTPTISVNLEKESYDVREEVTLSISALGLDEGNIAKLSLSVTADNFVPYQPEQENILSYLYINSEIENPLLNAGAFFNGEDDKKIELLNEALSQAKFKRYSLDDLASAKFPAIRYGNEQEINIRGQLLKNGKPVNNGEALLWLKDRFQTFVSTNTDEEGYFAFRGFYYTGEIPVVVQGGDHRGRREQVEVIMGEEEYTPPLLSNRIKTIGQPPRDYAATVLDQFRRTEAEVGAMELGELLLDEIVVEGRAEIHKPFRLHTQPDMVLFRKQLPVAPSGNILEVLQGRVAGLQVIRRGMNEFTATIRGQGTPLYLLDGMPIPENTLQMINPFDISRIEIIRRPSAAGIYGGRGGGGVIAMFTDIGYEEEIDIQGGKHIVVHRAQGFSRTRNFYSPTHEDMDYYDLPDLRSTLYWNPIIHLSNEGGKTFNFFTADTPGTYRVIIEGITTEGQALREVVTFEVGSD